MADVDQHNVIAVEVDAPPPMPKRKKRPPFRLERADMIVGVLLIITMIFGAYLRFVGQNWDDFTHLHPDERFLTGVTENIGRGVLNLSGDEAEKARRLTECQARNPNTNGVGGYFDTSCSDLYPPNIGHPLYVYGELPLFVVRLAGEIYSSLTNNRLWVSYTGAQLVGRSVSAVSDLITIFFIFLTTRYLFGRWTGLLAAFLYTVSVLPIQLSHFWTADAFSVMPIAISFFFAVRVMDRAKWYDFIGFGVAFGAAIASRINTLPLLGVIILAAIIYALPVLDITLPGYERSRLLTRAATGLAICAVSAFLVFRILSPHAFTGPSILGIVPWSPFFAQIKEAQYQTSGAFDIPPNYQWVNRPQYIFAWRNIVLWGMGLPLGLIAWGGWAFALLHILRARRQWTRLAIPVAWILVYFALIGRNWVATMRYFIVIYPALAMCAAWFLVESAKWATRTFQRNPTPTRRFVQAWAVGSLIFVTVFSALWGMGFARGIYGRQLTRVEASQYILRNMPSAISATIKLDDGRTRLYNFPYGGTATGDLQKLLQIQREAPVSGTVEEINLPHALDSGANSSRQTTLQVRLVQIEGNQVLGEGTIHADFTSVRTSRYGDPYTVKLDKPAQVKADQQYWVQVLTDGNPITLTGTVIATEGPWDDPIPWKVCQLPAEVELSHDIPSGQIPVEKCKGVDGFGEKMYEGLELYMVAEDNDQKRETIQTSMDGADYITISSNRFYDTLPRDPARFPMTTKFYREFFAGNLGFKLEKTFASWIQIGPFSFPDQALPTDNLPSWMNEWESEEAFSVYDHPVVFLYKKVPNYNNLALKEVLYGTNTNDQSVIQSGQYEQAILAGKINWASNQASQAPTAFMLTPEQLSVQQSGGTWSQLFNRNSPLNTSALGIVAFYFTLLVFGWITWPLLATILPGLSDKGYPIAKFAGLVIVSWLVWVGGTLNLLTWTAPGILATMIGLAVVSVICFIKNRAALTEFLRTRGRYILIIEGITLALFLAFLLVRLGNPDLWAQSLGGEKPMDFSYWNAVLRSTTFPPYDPWYSGGYLNYYYYGYVIVGTPVKLLGIMPQIAYNLVLPMLFACTGMGAFSVAYNLVAGRTLFPRDEGDGHKEAPAAARRRWALRTPAGNPIVAGIAAMLLCVVLGNLDTPRIILNGVASAGGYSGAVADPYNQVLAEFLAKNEGRAPTPEENDKLLDDAKALGASPFYSIDGLRRYLEALGKGFGNVAQSGYIPIGPDRWFWGPSRVLGELPNASSEITEFPYFTFVYADLHAHMIAMPVQLLALAWLLAELMAAGRIQRPLYATVGATLFGGLVVGILFPTNTWDWITYMLLAVVGLTFAAWLRANRNNSANPTVGYYDFSIFGLLNLPLLGFVRKMFTRRSVIQWLALVVGFFVAQQVAGQPFRAYFATGFSSVSPFLGNKSPLWAFFDIHGLFIFILASLLFWQTVRILRRTYVRDLLRARYTVMLIIAVIFVTFLITLVFTTLNLQSNIFIFDPPYPAAWVILPMITWSAILFFLPDQSREMRIVLALTILALALIMGAEMVTLANDSGRQNTIFKLYMQVWIIFACIGGAGLAWLVRASERWGGGLRSMWLAFAALLFSIAGLFPIMSTQGKIAMRMAPQAPHVLDGLAFMNYATYAYGDKLISLKDDLAIITWLQDNVQGTPVILEAQLPEYQLGSRIVMNTGLPTVLGYRYHQSQQRSLEPMGTLIWGRVGNIGTLYNTTDYDIARGMLRFYNIEYIIVGGLERAYYKPEGLMKFSALAKAGELQLVYEKGEDRIYRVLPIAKEFRQEVAGIGDQISQ